MKILIDTNVILDFALVRQPFYDFADRIFALIEQRHINGYICASTYTDLFYILKKPRGKEWTLNFLQKLSNLCEIALVDSAVVKEALDNYHKDFEDDIQYYSAVFACLDAIVTRNPDDFLAGSLQILTPEQLLQRFGS